MSPSLQTKLTKNSLCGVGVVRENQKLLPEIEKVKKRKAPKGKKQQKAKLLVNVFLFKSEETFNCGDSNFLVSKDELVALRWKDSKLGILLSNSMDPSNLNSVEQQQKGKLKKLRVMCPAIIKEHNSREWGRHRSSYRRCSVKKLFLEISQNSQENSCAKACRF